MGNDGVNGFLRRDPSKTPEAGSEAVVVVRCIDAIGMSRPPTLKQLLQILLVCPGLCQEIGGVGAVWGIRGLARGILPAWRILLTQTWPVRSIALMLFLLFAMV